MHLMLQELWFALFSRLLSCSLLLLKTHALQSGEVTPDLFMTLTHILDLFVKAWQEQEERRRQKEEEEAALYRFKDRSHGDGRTEEEKEEDAFREAFPSFRDVRKFACALPLYM